MNNVDNKVNPIMSSEPKVQSDNKYLIFQLNEVLYGLDILNVVEILEYKSPTKVPNLPLFVHGLLNLRGKVLPVIDFNLYLGKSSAIISKKTCIVIMDYLLKGQVNSVGILVDNVLDVIEVSLAVLENTPDFGVNIKPEFVQNMFILNNQIIILLNVNNLFVKPILEQI